MRSLVLVGPSELRIEERPTPTPGPGEALLRVGFASICHTDIYTMAGGYVGMRYPTVLGHEFSATVEACGEGVSCLKVGDRVTSMGFVYCGLCSACRSGWHVACQNLKAMPRDIEGAFQELVAMPVSALFQVPDSLSLREAALVEPASCAYNAVECADIHPGSSVVVIGCGPIGLLAVQAAALRLPRSLVALDLYPNRLKMAAELGATQVVNVRESDPDDAIVSATGGSGADAVLLCGGAEEAWLLAGRVLAVRGRVVVEAMPPTPDARWSVPVLDFTQKLISYIGAGGFSAAQFETVLNLIAQGDIRVAPLITHRFPLERYDEAIQLADRRKDIAIKVLFDLRGRDGGEVEGTQ